MPNAGDQYRQLHEVLGSKVGPPRRQHHERIGRGQVRPSAWKRDYRAVSALDPDPVTMPAGPFVDPRERPAEERVEGVSDANPSRRRFGIGCS